MTPEECCCCVLAFAVIASIALCAWFCSCRGKNAIEGFGFDSDKSEMMFAIQDACDKGNSVACYMKSRAELLNQLMSIPPKTTMKVIPKNHERLKPLCATDNGLSLKCIQIMTARGGSNADVNKYQKCRSGNKVRKTVCNELAMYGQFTQEYLISKGLNTLAADLASL